MTKRNKNKKSLKTFDLRLLTFSVGMRRFELPTSSTPCWRDTGLRYIPKRIILKGYKYILSGRNS